MVLTQQIIDARRKSSCAVNTYEYPLTQKPQGSQATKDNSPTFIYRSFEVPSQEGDDAHGEDLGE